MTPNCERADLPSLSDLKVETTDGLIGLWCQLYGTRPPLRVRRETILRIVSYKVQELQQGGPAKSSKALIKSARRQIERPGANEVGSRAILFPGTTIIRDWGGERHEVVVLDSGFEYRGEQFRSLSAIAYFVTGTKRSGPLFFGLRDCVK